MTAQQRRSTSAAKTIDVGDEPAESMLVAEVRKKHPKAADKLAAQMALEAAVRAAPGGHRALTEEEVEQQNANALTIEEYAAVRRIEYGTFVAAEEIFHNGAPAYREGGEVPISNVEKYGYDQTDPPQVRRVAVD